MRHLGTAFSDVATALSTDNAGNVLVVGNTDGALADAGTADAEGDAFLTKYDASGEVLWTQQFGSIEMERAAAASIDGSGNLYVAGVTNGALAGQTSLGGYDAFLRKYDEKGVELWTQQFGSADFDQAYAVGIDAAGNVYVAGTAGAALSQQTSLGGDDAFLRKYDAAGTELWTRQFGTDGNDDAFGLSVDGSGNVIAVGIAAGVLADQVASERDGFVRKYDANGIVLWTQQLGSARTPSVFADANGNVHVASTTAATLPGQVSSGRRDAYLRKYDSTGLELWTRQFGTSGIDEATAVIVDSAGKVFVGGSTDGAPFGLGEFGARDIFIRAYTASGDVLWTDRFGGTGVDEVSALVLDAAGGLFACGTTTGILPGQTSQGGRDGIVMKIVE